MAVLSNVTNPAALSSLTIASQTVKLTGTPLSNLKEYRAIELDGTYPAGATARAHGVIQYIGEDKGSEVFATIVTLGTAILEVEPAQTIAIGGEVAVNSSGKAVAAAAGNYVHGIALNGSTGSTSGSPHWIAVHLVSYKLPA